MTRARETFLKQGREPGPGADLRGSLKAVPNPNLEPSVKARAASDRGRWITSRGARTRREWTPASQHGLTAGNRFLPLTQESRGDAPLKMKTIFGKPDYCLLDHIKPYQSLHTCRRQRVRDDSSDCFVVQPPCSAIPRARFPKKSSFRAL